MNSGSPPPAPWLVLGGVAIGFVAAMCGIGGGLFAVPLLHFVWRLELRHAVATSLVMVLATAVAATAVESLRSSPDLRLELVIPLAVGAVVGAQLGYLAGRRLSATALRWLFVVALPLAGVRMLQSSPPVAEGATFGVSAALFALCAGFGGGVVAPLLGIGGGLVFVPALYLGLDAAGHDVARACSLAAAVATASRSLWLYGREGVVHARPGLWLAGGALLGSAAGVLQFHRGWAEAGRVGLAVILFAVAGRFLVDVLRRPQA